MVLAARQRDAGGGGARSRSPDGDRDSSRATTESDSATGSEEEAVEGYRKGARAAWQYIEASQRAVALSLPMA